jgi:hypothetical protein
MHRKFRWTLKKLQAEALQWDVERHPFRGLEGPLAPSGCLVAGQDYEVVCIADEFRIGPACRSARAVEGFLKPVPIDVRQQGRENSPLRRSLSRVGQLPLSLIVPFGDRRLEPHHKFGRHRTRVVSFFFARSLSS